MSAELAERIPANAQDLLNHMSGYLGCNHEIHCILGFEENIDFALLNKAVALLFTAEPILSCRLIENQDTCYWVRRADLKQLESCSLLETQDVESEMRKFINVPVDSYQDPLLQVKLLRSGQGDRLCIKINHACCDAGGLKECVALLASLYNKLLEEPGYIPVPNRSGQRGYNQIFEQIDVVEAKKAWEAYRPERDSWSFPMESAQNMESEYAVKKIGRAHWRQIYEYARSRGVTVNDILLTACYRAMFTLVRPEPDKPMSFLVTVDLRRYVPGHKAGAICNLSGLVIPAISRILGESFEDTLGKVAEAMNTLKASIPGLHTAIVSEIYSRIGAAAVLDWLRSEDAELCSPIFSNIGVISNEPLNFGKVKAKEGYMIGPAMAAPASLLAISTYNEEMTLSMAFYEPAISKSLVECFFEQVVREIPVEG
ncbi:MAG: hypothetical protein H6Q72_2292 [Firmicutes bacterium]|nr:hypothetical protein [Bacillota bacterium]